MNHPLRPMNLGEILDRTFQIYKSRFLVFVGIAAIPALIMMALHLADIEWLHSSRLSPAVNESGTVLWNLLLAFGYYHISSVLGYFFDPAAVRQSSDVVMGTPESFLSALGFIKARWRSFLWVSVLKVITILLAPEALLAGIIFLFGTIADKTDAPANLPVIFVVIFLPAFGGIICFLWLGACFSLAVPAAALEQLKGLHAMRRSWNLSRDSRARIAIAWILILVVSLALAAACQFLLSITLLPVYNNAHKLGWSMTYRGISYGISAVIASLIGSLNPIVITLFYYDQRIRKEGFDIEHMMHAAGWTTEIAQPTQPLPPSEPLPEAHA